MKEKEYTVRQLKKLMEILQGSESDRVQEVLGSGILSDVFDPSARLNRLAVRRALGLGAILSTPGSHVVNYGMTLEHMIAASNCDRECGNIIAGQFPIVGEGDVEFEDMTLHFDRHICAEDVSKEIRIIDPKNPWGLGKIENVLAYGAKNPKERRKFAIVVLGSTIKVCGGRKVPFLDEDFLQSGFWDSFWTTGCRFLIVRKKVCQQAPTS
jgi:hypothetical protein